MPRVSVIILTKNRAVLLQKALASLEKQNFRDFEIVVVNDGSIDDTEAIILACKHSNIVRITHSESQGITKGRQEALEKASGELVAFLDDDDEWVDRRKLEKQVEWFEKTPRGVLCGGGIVVNVKGKNQNVKLRPKTDGQIREWMLFKNPFFTSTVMVKVSAALEVGGFVQDSIDLAEDYDLWLRLGQKGEMYNFQEVFTKYTLPVYNKDKFKLFLTKQLYLVKRHKNGYPNYWLAQLILRLRLFF